MKTIYLILALTFPLLLVGKSNPQIFTKLFVCCDKRFRITVFEDNFEQSLYFDSESSKTFYNKLFELDENGNRVGKLLSVKKTSNSGNATLWNIFLEEDKNAPPAGETIVDVGFDGENTLFLALASSFGNTFSIIPIDLFAEAKPISNSIRISGKLDSTKIKPVTDESKEPPIAPLTNEIIFKLKSVTAIKVSPLDHGLSIEIKDKYGKSQNLLYNTSARKWSFID